MQSSEFRKIEIAGRRLVFTPGLLALALALVAIALTASVASPGTSRTPVAKAVPVAAASAPGVFGINMSLFTAEDQLATDSATQQTFRSWGVPYIRMPLREELDDAALTKGMQAIKAVGAAPVLIIRGAKENSLQQNLHYLDLIQGVFGTSTVYLEFGNEEDLEGIDAEAYTSGWNEVVPQIKQRAPATYKFIGPVNFEYNPEYIAYFAGHANPRPDLLSWHEYVCNGENDDSYCMEHIQSWARHVQEVNAAVRQAIGTTLPFFISEWNLDPNDGPRYDNAEFIQPWTTQALSQMQALTRQGLVGAMIYTSTDHGAFGLLDGDQVTPQGQAFRNTIGRPARPVPPASPPPSPTAPPPTPTQPPPTPTSDPR